MLNKWQNLFSEQISILLAQTAAAEAQEECYYFYKDQLGAHAGGQQAAGSLRGRTHRQGIVLVPRNEHGID